MARGGPLHGIGIDSWAVDYGLLDRDGRLLGQPYSHRDRRTDGVLAGCSSWSPSRSSTPRTGLQQLPFNTLYQLVAARGTAALEAAATLLLRARPPRLLADRGVGAERTNASTTQLYDVTHAASGRPTWPSGSGCRRRSCRRCATRASVVGPLLPERRRRARPRRRTCR